MTSLTHRRTIQLATTGAFLVLALAFAACGPLQLGSAPARDLAVGTVQRATAPAPEPAIVVPATTTLPDDLSPLAALEATSPPTTAPAALGSLSGAVVPAEGWNHTLALEYPDGTRADVALDDAGRYEVDGLPAGTYTLEFTNESPWRPCEPGQPCVGSAIQSEARSFDLAAGESHREDWS